MMEEAPPLREAKAMSRARWFENQSFQIRRFAVLRVNVWKSGPIHLIVGADPALGRHPTALLGRLTARVLPEPEERRLPGSEMLSS